MSVLSTEEENLLAWLLSSIPRWLWMNDTTRSAQEVWAGAVKSLYEAQRQGESWNLATFIMTATDVWLNQHARDRGTQRQGSETDDALRERLRSYEDAVTNPAILAAVQAILDAESIAGTAVILELRRDKMHWRVPHNSLDGTGATASTFTKVGNVITLDTGVALTGYERGRTVTIAGSTTPGNDGTFTITDVLTNDQLVYTNAAGATEALAVGTTWKIDADLDGRCTGYWGRGYRLASNRSAFIVILPYGSTAGTQAAVREALRKKKAGGIRALVERRINP